MKIFSIYEFKSTLNNTMNNWFNELQIKINKWFENDLSDLELEKIDYYPGTINSLYTVSVYFNEGEFEYRFDVSVDISNLDIEIIVISDVYVTMTLYSDGKLIRDISNELKQTDLVPDLIINLINEVKIEESDRFDEIEEERELETEETQTIEELGDIEEAEE